MPITEITLFAATVAAHFFCEHGRPPPSELASCSSGVEEGFLRLEPHHFLFGAQTFLSSAIHTLDIFHLPGSQFFSYGRNLCPPSFSAPSAFGRCQSPNRHFKIIEFNRLDEVRLRAGAQSLLYVTPIGCGRVKQYRSVRVELANKMAQPDARPVRQPVVQDVKVEVPPPG